MKKTHNPPVVDLCPDGCGRYLPIALVPVGNLFAPLGLVTRCPDHGTLGVYRTAALRPKQKEE